MSADAWNAASVNGQRPGNGSDYLKTVAVVLAVAGIAWSAATAIIDHYRPDEPATAEAATSTTTTTTTSTSMATAATSAVVTATPVEGDGFTGSVVEAGSCDWSLGNDETRLHAPGYIVDAIGQLPPDPAKDRARLEQIWAEALTGTTTSQGVEP